MKSAIQTAVTGIATEVLASNGISTDERLKRIDDLDLSGIRSKLVQKAPHGVGMDENVADLAIKWYKRFLQVRVKYPDQICVPNELVDTAWHYHILDTRAYAVDCQNVFGHFMHHDPYYGRGKEHDEHEENFIITNELYRQEFGEDCLKHGAVGIECTDGPCK